MAASGGPSHASISRMPVSAAMPAAAANAATPNATRQGRAAVPSPARRRPPAGSAARAVTHDASSATGTSSMPVSGFTPDKGSPPAGGSSSTSSSLP